MELAVLLEPLDRHDARPSACTAKTVHDFTGSPSSRTVQAPQCVVSQPIWVPVSRRFSRRRWTSSSRGSTSASCAVAVDRDAGSSCCRHAHAPPARATAVAQRARGEHARHLASCIRPSRADRPPGRAAAAASCAASRDRRRRRALAVQERLGLGRLDRRRADVGQADARRCVHGAARVERELHGDARPWRSRRPCARASDRRRRSGLAARGSGSRSGSRRAQRGLKRPVKKSSIGIVALALRARSRRPPRRARASSPDDRWPGRRARGCRRRWRRLRTSGSAITCAVSARSGYCVLHQLGALERRLARARRSAGARPPRDVLEPGDATDVDEMARPSRAAASSAAAGSGRRKGPWPRRRAAQQRRSPRRGIPVRGSRTGRGSSGAPFCRGGYLNNQ